jgi:hypothetical protein
MMYEGFQCWIIRVGDGAGALRLVDLCVRGTLFKPKRAHTQSVLLHGQLIQVTPGVASNGREQFYSPPDGDASFKIDLSEKYQGGKVQLVRNDGTAEAGEQGRAQLSKMVEGLWEKRMAGTLNGQDWVTMVDDFITYIGGWVRNILTLLVALLTTNSETLSALIPSNSPNNLPTLYAPLLRCLPFEFSPHLSYAFSAGNDGVLRRCSTTVFYDGVLRRCSTTAKGTFPLVTDQAHLGCM